MRVFVSEFVVGGACLGMDVSASMRREGLAMLRAVTEDIAKLPETSVVTTLEAGLSLASKVETVIIEQSDHEAAAFQRLLDEVDAVLIIAPETSGILAERCRRVRASQAISWNCTPDAIELCGDKLRLSKYLLSLGISTPVTHAMDFTQPPESHSWPVVLKPIDGAGSHLTFLIHDLADFHRARRSFEQADAMGKCICQPYVSGRPLSIGVNISLDGQRREILPVAAQCLSADGRFHYLGGRVPADISEASVSSVRRLVERACSSITGLSGYVGFDLVLPPCGDPMVIEINPRLTTSYVGYRQLFQHVLPLSWVCTTTVECHKNSLFNETLKSPIEFTPMS